METILAVGGHDPSGCAGLLADVRALSAHGFHAAAVPTALTVQNTRECREVVPVAAGLVAAQIRAVLADLRVVAVKSGLLGSRQAVEALAAALAERPDLPFVLDPVFRSSTGGALLGDDARAAMEERLFPRAAIVTPNASEAQALSGLPVTDPDSAAEAGCRLLAGGCRAVLVKGGHFARQRGTDVLVTPQGVTSFPGEAVPARHTRGTGCTLAAALAAQLALGEPLATAIAAARLYLVSALQAGRDVGAGPGPVGVGIVGVGTVSAGARRDA